MCRFSQKNAKDAVRDFDLLDNNDWFGVTYAGYDGNLLDETYIPIEELGAGSPHDRLLALAIAHMKGVKTWVSAEPVINAIDVLELMELADYVDKWKVGKMNYHESNIDWAAFGRLAKATLQSRRKEYYIKESLRKEMEK